MKKMLLLALLCLTGRALAETPRLSVDFSQPAGTIRAIHGTNLWCRLSGDRILDLTPETVRMRFPLVRLHDAPLFNPGMRLVDTQHIFGNIHADPKDPANYYFEQTDHYIRRILDNGSKVLYRLGSSIEHTQVNYYAKRPDDMEKYAEICAGIVRHYNNKWADGHEWGIEYWEIWNEPNLIPQMWNFKDFQTYCDFYVIVAKRLRAEFPDIKIGGPAITWADPKASEMLIKTCRDAGAPLDFFSWHCYARTPGELLNPPAKLRALLDKYGFTQTELHLNEWHYFPAKWSEMHGREGGYQRKRYWLSAPEGLHGVDAAGFVGYVLSRWQDTPLTMSNYYATTSPGWGILNHDGEIRKPYYTFVAFADLVKNAPNRVKTEGTENLSLLAGTGENGVKMLLVSSWKWDCESLEIALGGVPESGTVRVRRLDGTHNDMVETVNYTGSVLKITNAPGSFVLLVEWI
ncbi:MAG: hypothetical protein Q4D98_05515 [Planctomycetia bacterium]|nr:hypothetical protein [Planctomycetia bacterium]